jgi:hypothetical protein
MVPVPTISIGKKSTMRNDDQHAVAYYRLAAQGQNEDSPAVQRETIRRWADAQGIAIIRAFSDPAPSPPTAPES